MTQFQAFLGAKCPQCHVGHLFKGSLFSTRFKDTHSHCSHCKVKFESEPGFFWGAMYFSYALTVITIIIIAVIIYSAVDKPPLFETSSTIIGISLLLTPIHMRLSRLLMVYIAAPYRKYKPGL